MTTPPLKVTLCSTSDKKGGGFVATRRLLSALLAEPTLQPNLLVQTRAENHANIIEVANTPSKKEIAKLKFIADRSSLIPYLNHHKIDYNFSAGFYGTPIDKHPLLLNAEIINLHWVYFGFIGLNTLLKIAALNKPIVWTMHDAWAFTGGCFYPMTCRNFENSCGNCPYLAVPTAHDISHSIWQKKQQLYPSLNLTVVTCSEWLAKESLKSSLLADKPTFVIPNPIDVEVYKPVNKATARIHFGLPAEKKLLLFGAVNINDERKGFSYLMQALEYLYLSGAHTDTELCVFGKSSIKPGDLPFRVHQLGNLTAEQDLVMAYSAADVFLCPSLADNLPNTIMESMACGTAVIAFEAGGIPDMVKHGLTGLLAPVANASALAMAINNFLSSEKLQVELSKAARLFVEKNYNFTTVAKQYSNLYYQVYENHRRTLTNR